MRDLLEHIYTYAIQTPSLLRLALCTFITFVAVYRWGLPRFLTLNFPKLKKYKVLNCESCFAFWLCLLISTNLLTGIIAYLVYNFYEKD